MERLLDDANLDDYLLVINPQNNSIIIEDSLLVVQNQRTSMMELAAFEQVAHHFNLLKVDNGDGTFSIIFGSAQHTSNAGSKGIKEWTQPETVRIIQLVTEYTDQVGTLKRFATKKVMWKHIASQLNGEFNISVNPTQVENRYKTVLNKNKKRIEHNRTSGNDRMVTPYDDEFNQLARKDSTIDPFMMTQHGEIMRNSDALEDAGPSTSIINNNTGTSSTSGNDNPDEEEEIPEQKEEKEKEKKKENKKDKKPDKGKKEDKEQKKKTNISVMTELYRNQCEFRAQEREEYRKEKELAKAKADKDKMERFQYAQDRKDIRHQQRLEVLKDLVNVLKAKDDQ